MKMNGKNFKSFVYIFLINECTSQNQPHHKGLLHVAANGAHTARAYTGFRACLHGHWGLQLDEVARLGGVTCLSMAYCLSFIDHVYG